MRACSRPRRLRLAGADSLCDASASGASSTAPASPPSHALPQAARTPRPTARATAIRSATAQPISYAFLVGSYSHLDQVFEGRLVRRATTPSPLARVASEPAVRYEYQGHTFTLDDYLTRHPATGLLVARGDTILIERYQYARHDRHRFASWSMAKTVTAMLVGIALAEGHIRSVDDPAAAYVPALAGTEYGRTSLRHLLQMSSGVRFVEEYSGLDDVWRLAADTFRQGGAEASTP